MKKFVSTFLVIWATWIALSGTDIHEIIIGGVSSLVLSVIISRFVEYSFDLLLPVRLVKFIVLYIPIFVYKLVLANLDIAYRVLSPALPINPGFVKVPTKLQGKIGKLILANSITLTPGTLSVDVQDGYIYIHWINVQGENNDDYQKHVSESFEKVLGGIF